MTCEDRVSALLGFPLLPPWDRLVQLLCAQGADPMEVMAVLAWSYLDASRQNGETTLRAGPFPTIARDISSDKPLTQMLLTRALNQVGRSAIHLEEPTWNILLAKLINVGLGDLHAICWMFEEYALGNLGLDTLEAHVRRYRVLFRP